MYVCNACMYATHVCMHCMYVCLYVYIYMYLSLCFQTSRRGGPCLFAISAGRSRREPTRKLHQTSERRDYISFMQHVPRHALSWSRPENMPAVPQVHLREPGLPAMRKLVILQILDASMNNRTIDFEPFLFEDIFLNLLDFVHKPTKINRDLLITFNR